MDISRYISNLINCQLNWLLGGYNEGERCYSCSRGDGWGLGNVTLKRAPKANGGKKNGPETEAMEL